ncbi:hypothetical protein ASG78_01550 [Nostocoides sp. Soil756]|nr:hypothetical protein ASG78_01550 [Tetrasphaera sp. Soil756]
MPPEELGLEGQAEQARQAQLAGAPDQPVEDGRPHPAAHDTGVDRQRADLAQVLPQHVHRPAAHDTPVGLVLGHHEVDDRLVVGHGLLLQQHPALGQRSHEGPDGADVGGAGRAHEHAGRGGREAGVRGHDRHCSAARAASDRRVRRPGARAEGRPATAGVVAGRCKRPRRPLPFK